MESESLKRAKRKWYLKNKERILQQRKHKYNYNTIVGRAYYLRNAYIEEDRKQGRIGKDLPKNYVTLSDVVHLITKKCAHFDKCGSYGWRKIGLNRLDNSKPHTIDNIEPCCMKCNKILRNKEFNNCCKIVYQYVLDGKLVKIWKSIKECKENGYSRSAISDCCRNRYLRKGNNEYKGYKWSYKPL